MLMEKYYLICLIVVFSLSSRVYAQSEFPSLDGRGGVYIELGGRSDPDAIGGEIGISHYASEDVSVRGGLAFFASDSSDDIFGGGTLDVRFNLGKKISPFLGFGVFVGYSDETVSAENDDIDNDDDGSIDEDGEEKAIVTDLFASIFPEVGIHFFVSDTTRLTVASRYQMTTEGRDNDNWIYNFGIAFIF